MQSDKAKQTMYRTVCDTSAKTDKIATAGEANLSCQWVAYTIKAEKLETKHDGYSSFFVRADRSLRDALMDPDIWPINSMVRLFFEC